MNGCANQGLIIAFLIVSAVLSCGTLLCGIINLIKSIIRRERSDNKAVWYLLVFVVSIWFLRYAVGYYSIAYETAVTSGLNKVEEIFNSVVHTFQTFSMDEDYTSYIRAGKDMMRWLCNKDEGDSVLVTVFGVYASVLNVFAPICGGAILLNILQGVFPGVRLFFKRLAFWKRKYYFSELNERSLACAKSILCQNYPLFCKPIIVFTDVYTDGEDEFSSELYKKARANGAICLQDDITHLKHRYTSKKEYWLIDDNEIDNIKTLAEFSDGKHFKNVAKTIIRIFYQDNSYVMTEKKIVNRIEEQFAKAIREKSGLRKAFPDLRKAFQKNGGAAENEADAERELQKRVSNIAPPVSRIRCYQNMICSFLKQEPLYTPLINRENPTSLDVGIIGNGSIGMEMFLSTYWFGQLLDIPLSINVISKDTVETACAQINKINSDILESTKNNAKLLEIYPGDNTNYSEPYFTFRYGQADLETDNISDVRCVVPECLRDTAKDGNSILFADADYILVALGNDDLNIRIAEELAKYISVSQLNSGKHKDVNIAYIVYDTHLAASLNGDTTPFGQNIRMKAIGSLDDVYSFENILMGGSAEEIRQTESDYNRISYSKSVDEMHNRMDTLYDYYSSYANSCHYMYKVFSAYIYNKRRGCTDSWEKWQDGHKKYICESKDELAEKLAWLEHRRWNAYMRAIGFKYSNKIKGNTKDLKLQIHSCLAECKKSSADSEKDDYVDLVKKIKPKIKEYDYSGIVRPE